MEVARVEEVLEVFAADAFAHEVSARARAGVVANVTYLVALPVVLGDDALCVSGLLLEFRDEFAAADMG